MSTFGQMQANNALAIMAKLLNSDIGILLNKAQRDEVEAYPWSFLLSNLVLYPTATINLTSLSLHLGSAIATATVSVLPVYSNQAGGFFLRIGGSSNALIPVNVSTTGPNTLTLTLIQGQGTPEAWGGPTMTTTGTIINPLYQIVGFQEIYNVRQITELTKVSREYLNLLDPTRNATGGNPSIMWADAGWTTGNSPQSVTPLAPMIELWEPPSAVLPYVVEGKLAANTMVNPGDNPQLPSAVIENKALSTACYALFASNGNNKYMSLGDKYYAIYQEELEKAKTADTRRTNKNNERRASPGLDIISIHDLFNPRLG